MGTNYYARFNVCHCCGRGTRLHIGKASVGWSFTFRGYKDLQPPILSWDDWKKHLSEPAVLIDDEYGTPLSLDQLIDLVESKKSKLNFVRSCRGEYKEHLSNRHISDQTKQWLDNEGNAFQDMDFS